MIEGIKPELDRITLAYAERGLRKRPFPPKFYEKETIGYIAGKFEGEGYISWGRDPTKPWLYILRIGVDATDKRQIDRIASLWNTGVREVFKPLPRHSLYRVYATGLRAYRILEIIAPFLTPESPKRKRVKWVLSHSFMISEDEHSEFLRL